MRDVADRVERVPDIIGQIRDIYCELATAEECVAVAILPDVREAGRTSYGEIVSQPTVTRLFRSTGCEGVRDFKLQLAQALAVGEAFLASGAAETPPREMPPFRISMLGEARAAIRDVERQLAPHGILRTAQVIAGLERIAPSVSEDPRPRSRSKLRSGSFSTVGLSTPAASPA